MKKRLFRLSFGIVLIFALGACMPAGGRPGAPMEAGMAFDSEIVIDPVAVETDKIIEADFFEQVYVVGQLEAEDEYNVLPYTSGLVETIDVAIGDQVQVGDVLYTLDASDLETNRDSSLKSSQISKEQSYNSLLLSEKDLESSKMTLSNAQKNLEDNTKLFEGGFITQAALDNYEDSVVNAQYSYDRSKVSLSNAQKNYNQAIDAYNNSVSDFENNLSDMTITSPIDGTVTRIDVQVDTINNMNAGITITGSKEVVVSAKVIEKYINTVEVGQKTSILVDAVDKTFMGEIRSVAISSPNSYYPIEMTLENSDGLLKAGMYAGVTIDTQLVENIISVPKVAVIGSGSTKYVYINQEGIAVKKVVTLGRDFGQVTEVVEGLVAGDELVVVGQAYLEEGTPLIISE